MTELTLQCMLQPRRRKAVKDDVMEAIRAMGVLQIETISVVARSPYLVMWSRLGDYDPAWLDQHLAEGRLFEYWAHEACFVPIEDYGLYRHRMLDPSAMGWKYPATWADERAGEVAAVLAHIRANGPTRSSDFERTDGESGGWWQWKGEKRSLAVHLRAADDRAAPQLPARVRPGRTRPPEWHDNQLAPHDEVRRELVLRAVKALGVCKAAWIPDYHRTRRPHPDA